MSVRIQRGQSTSRVAPQRLARPGLGRRRAVTVPPASHANMPQVMLALRAEVDRLINEIGLYIDEDGRVSNLDFLSSGVQDRLAEAGMTDYGLAVALGRVPKLDDVSKINKFGQAPDCDSGVATDIWDGADGATSTDIWVAPTQARVHNIASTSANDDFNPAGTGLRTLRVYGLTDWDTAEVSEDIEMNGGTNVATSSSYVIIHRMKGLTFGSGGTNAGTITATAVTDATVTAAIQIGEGQTLMAIYGVPSTQTLHIKMVYDSALRSVAGVNADIKMLVKENADQSDAAFITKDRWQIKDTNNPPKHYDPPKSFTGPCVVKFQADTSANNTEVALSFDAYVVDN